jgi:hypothetical protein
LVVRKTKGVDLGGDGARDGFTLEVTGCECRTLDFEMAFRKFVKGWVKEADMHSAKREQKKPCGCQDNA